jgi:hypothetical protein
MRKANPALNSKTLTHFARITDLSQSMTIQGEQNGSYLRGQAATQTSLSNDYPL